MLRGKRKVFHLDCDDEARATVRSSLSPAYEVRHFEGHAPLLRAVGRQECDLVVAEYAIEKPAGVDFKRLIGEIHKTSPFLPVLVTASEATVELVVRIFKMGAGDLLGKPISKDALLSSVQCLTGKFNLNHHPASVTLSRSEKQVLQYVLLGMTSHEIAAATNRSTRTVEDHRARVMDKMVATNVVELVTKIYGEGVIALNGCRCSKSVVC